MTATTVRESTTVPPELLRLIEEIDRRPARVETIAPSDSYRPAPGAFRVSLADGRRFKARLLGGARRAASVDCILRALGHAAFPEVVARQGRVLLLEWIEGVPVDEQTSHPTVIRAAAAVQAFLHAAPVPPALERPPAVLAETGAKLREDLAALAAAGTVTAAEAAAILDLVRRFAPERCRIGIVHRDLCARNMIVRPSGEVCVVDNETMAVGSCEFDLARTWYRWPLPRAERERYLRVYARTHDPRLFLAHFPFWALAVLVDSAQLRRAAPAALASVPLDRLRRLLAAVRDGAAPERLAFES
jgi:aminoglycoside phosphotransferase